MGISLVNHGSITQMNGSLLDTSWDISCDINMIWVPDHDGRRPSNLMGGEVQPFDGIDIGDLQEDDMGLPENAWYTPPPLLALFYLERDA